MRNSFYKENKFLAAVLASLLMLSVGAVAQNSGESMTLRNRSSFSISEFYVSRTTHTSWEEDVLGSRTLRPGHNFSVTGVDPGRYDIKLVDEDGDACILHDVNLYSDRTMTITNDWLLNCEFH